jgi:alkylated DNA repair dioxygenase AlkB
LPQLSLFQPDVVVLADDGRGRIAYTPRFVDGPTAEAWFGELRDAVDWKAERRRMYDREVDVPRLTASFALATDPGRSDGIRPPEAILEAARRVVAATGAPFNSVGLNHYRDGRDSVAPHNDHLDELVDGFPVALLSLGSTRRMAIRAKAPPRRTRLVDLEPGSLLVMSHASQRHYTHAIPKTADPVGPRISLAFRVRPVVGCGERDKERPWPREV